MRLSRTLSPFQYARRMASAPFDDVLLMVLAAATAGVGAACGGVGTWRAMQVEPALVRALTEAPADLMGAVALAHRTKEWGVVAIAAGLTSLALVACRLLVARLPPASSHRECEAAQP